MLDTFFNILKKSLVATIFIIFAFVATYIPQPHFSNVEEANASGVIGATEPTQIMNNVQLLGVNIATTASAGFDAITSWASNNLWLKEYVLDGIGWAIAKSIVSSMVQSLINWINSGFEGSPAFVQDLKGFLLNAADEAIGGFLEDLGGLGSFLCSPFRLDVQVAVALEYEEVRADGGDGQPAPSCTLSGIVGNVEQFISGSFIEGGLDGIFDISANPKANTPYGATLSAKAGMHARIVNAQGEEISLLDFGDGFLSGEICELVEGSGSSREDCFITKPGKIIEEALSFNLDSGRQSLIAADEINEIIAALLSQLANTVISGASGLLGLSSGTGYTYSGFSAGDYLDQVVQDSDDILTDSNSRETLVDARNTQVDIRDLALTYEPLLDGISGNSSEALRERNNARGIITDTTGSFPSGGSPGSGTIAELDALIVEFDDPATTDQRRIQIQTEFNSLPLYTPQQFTSYQTTWDRLLGADADRDAVITGLRGDIVDGLSTQIDMRNLAQSYEPLLATEAATGTPGAAAAQADAQAIITQTTGGFPAPSPDTGTIAEINTLLAEFDDPTTTQTRQSEIYNEYIDLSRYSDSDVTTTQTAWDAIIP